MDPDPSSHKAGFDRAASIFKTRISKALSDQFAADNDSLASLKSEIDAIQKQHGREGKLRNMRRAGKFIEAMTQFGQVIEVFVNANDFVCFIWGPMKFLLGIAKTHIDIFDKLMGAYDRIGDEIPGLLVYKTRFQKYPHLCQVLHDYYSDILRFHEEAIAVFGRSKWAKLFHSTWKTFNAQFDPILQSMRSRRELVESGKLSASLEEIQEAREKINDVYQRLVEQENQQAQERHLSRINRIKEKLCSPDYSIDQYASTEDRQATETGQWIFQEPKYTSWADMNSREAPILYLNGIPGAGKTTLVSCIIEELLNRKCTSQFPVHAVAYFYFKHGNAEKNSHNSFLRAFLLQLIDQNQVVSQEFLRELSAKADVAIRATSNLETLAKRALEEYPTSFLVLDGLDECATGEARKTVQWLLSLVGDMSDIRVIFSGQRDGLLDVLLSDRPSIPLESSHHAQDIRNFCRSRCKQLRTIFKGMEATLEEQIFTLVTTRAKGMFLYARVVLQNLSDQISLTGLKQEVQTGVFPADIDAAYDRVVKRVITEAPSAKQRGAKKVLGLVIAARRDLKWREIQSFFCINSTQGTIDYESRCQITCKELCGSLVDLHCVNGATTPPEALVRIVHETAKTYLIQNAVVNVAVENAKMAKFLTDYLVTSPFGNTNTSEDIVFQAQNGYYSLQDYAVQDWYHHCQAVADMAGNSNRHEATHLDVHVKEVTCSLQQFVQFYTKLHASKAQFDENIASRESLSDTLAKLPEDGQERTSYLNLELRTKWIRNEIESLEGLEDVAQAVLDDLHGPTNLFKCHKSWCPRFTDGFNTFGERTTHMNRHDRPFQCQYEDCPCFSFGFETETAAQEHDASYHSETAEDIRFPTSVRKPVSKHLSLLQAAKSGDITSVRSSLDAGQDINMRAPRSFKTPLWYAADNGHYELCELLINRGANASQPDGGPVYRSDTSLHVAPTAIAAAARRGDARILNLLLRYQTTSKSLTQRDFHTALNSAIKAGQLESVIVLATAYDSLFDANAESGVVLQEAIRSMNIPIIRVILQHRFQQVVDFSFIDYIRHFSFTFNLDQTTFQLIVEMLLSTGRPVITEKRSLQGWITDGRNFPSIVMVLLSYPKTKLETRDLEELQEEASKQRHSEIVDLIEGILASRRKESASETQKADGRVMLPPIRGMHGEASERLTPKQADDGRFILPSIRDMLGEASERPASPPEHGLPASKGTA